MAVTAKQWADDLLKTAKIKPTAPDEAFIENWLPMEGTKARNNPMATTLGSRASGVTVPGSTYFNSEGVQDYPTYQAGLGATASTLEESRYSAIFGALKSGNPTTYGNQAALSSEFRTWSGQGYSGVSSGTSPSYVSPGLAGATSTGAAGSIGGGSSGGAGAKKLTTSAITAPLKSLMTLTGPGHTTTAAGMNWWPIVLVGAALVLVVALFHRGAPSGGGGGGEPVIVNAAERDPELAAA